jgi:hypothetical protein
MAQITSSASRSSSCQVDSAGTATMTRAGRCQRTAVTASCMVEPVAKPSSTKITTLPWIAD